jgi:hypothetical protein
MTEKTVDAKAAKAYLADANWKETSYGNGLICYIVAKLMESET